jgi:hypothetical protein
MACGRVLSVGARLRSVRFVPVLVGVAAERCPEQMQPSVERVRDPDRDASDRDGECLVVTGEQDAERLDRAAALQPALTGRVLVGMLEGSVALADASVGRGH